MKVAVEKMKKYLANHRTDGKDKNKSTTALCLLLVIGTSGKDDASDTSATSDTSDNTATQRQGSFPNEDSYISVVVPSKDKFEINQTIVAMAGASHISELLASHSFAYAETNNKKALRNKANMDYHALGQRLLEDKQKLLQGQNQPN